MHKVSSTTLVFESLENELDTKPKAKLSAIGGDFSQEHI